MTSGSFAKRCDGRPLAPGLWLGRCPCHTGDEDSLIIHRGFDNRILLHCKAGCKPDAIVKAAGLSEQDFFGVLPAIMGLIEEIVRRPLPVNGVTATSQVNESKHERQTRQACG